MAFRAQRVMLSRSLVPPDLFDTLHGTLKENGAEVCLCSNPRNNLSNDFHVLTSCESEKFVELQNEGCNVVGPECILRCAQERRPIPSAKYTCCLALEGIRILATGFDDDMRAYIQKMVSAMCGELYTKISMDIDFVVAKDVLAPKYKWAAFTLRKPILTLGWLVHCFREHRRVSHDSYKLPIFAGIKMCTTGILLDERKKIANVVVQNGGSLRADLTRECTHLIAKSTASDKFKVAKKHWCHIKLVNEEWFWNSLSEMVCLEESSYSVQEATTADLVKSTMRSDPQISSAISGPTPEDGASQDRAFSGSFHCTGPEPAPARAEQVDARGPLRGIPATSGSGCEMYLSGCRIYLTGFDAMEMKRLVNMVLDGGGTRYVSFNERITHVIFGKPSESVLKDIRQQFTWGGVHVVVPMWLEECSRQKTEVAVSTEFVVPESLLLQDLNLKPGRNRTVSINEEKSMREQVGGMLESKVFACAKAQPDTRPCFGTIQGSDAHQQLPSMFATNPTSGTRQGSPTADLQKRIPEPVVDTQGQIQELTKLSMRSTAGSQVMSCVPSVTTLSQANFPTEKKVFQGVVFGFAPSFPSSTKAEVVQWVLEGGGIILGDVNNAESKTAKFLIVPHGPNKDPSSSLNTEKVTTQWIRYCLQEGTLLDVNSHILFQPLSCKVPLRGFESLRFAVSQYADRERILLYNLCHTLGAKYQEKRMTRRATHLLCKVGDGEKYEAALQWGIEPVTAEWLYACVTQNMVVLPDPYRPKRLTLADKEAGLAIPTQYPGQPILGEVGVSFTEEFSTQYGPQNWNLVQASDLESADLKGKATKRRKPKLQERSCLGSLEVLIHNKASTNLSSQMGGGNLDPWDELAAAWSGEGVIKRPSTRSQKSWDSHLGVLSNVPVNLEPSTIQGELRADLRQGGKANERSQGGKSNDRSQETENCREVLVSGEPRDPGGHNGSETEEEDTDVASAIEGLLAQTSKEDDAFMVMSLEEVQTGDFSRSPGVNRDVLSPDLTKLNRRNGEGVHSHTNFKRPKLISNRSMESGAEQLVQCLPPSEDSFEKFEESQMDSQVVAYVEDYSEKQRIMERVRTRSMSTTTISGSGVSTHRREKTSWQSTEFGRLLKAADANK